MIPRWMLSEARALAVLGLPMVGTQLAIMATGFVDTVMAGHYASLDLAGVQLGGSVLWPLFMLLSGFTMAVTPIVSQYRGAGDTGAAGVTIRQALWLGFFGGIVIVLGMLNAEPVFELFGVEPAIAEISMGYLQAAAWGVPPLMIYIVLRNTSEGLGQTVVPMVISVGALGVNAFFNYVLIYGKFGFPELGGVGCGYATAAVFWFEFLAMLFFASRPWFLETRFAERFAWPDAGEFWRILRLGVPIGLTVFLEMAVFAVLSFLVGALGVVSLAAHSIAGNLNWLTFVMPMALGQAAGIRVGFYVGARELSAARRAVATAVTVSLVYALVVSVLLILGRYWLVTIYTSDVEVIAVAATVLLFIAFYQLADDTQATMGGCLRGYKDTFWPMVLSLGGFWIIGLPVGAALALGWGGIEPLGVYGYWAGMSVGLALVAIGVGIRLWLTCADDARVLRLADR